MTWWLGGGMGKDGWTGGLGRELDQLNRLSPTLLPRQS